MSGMVGVAGIEPAGIASRWHADPQTLLVIPSRRLIARCYSERASYPATMSRG